MEEARVVARQRQGPVGSPEEQAFGGGAGDVGAATGESDANAFTDEVRGASTTSRPPTIVHDPSSHAPAPLPFMEPSLAPKADDSTGGPHRARVQKRPRTNRTMQQHGNAATLIKTGHSDRAGGENFG